MRNARDLSPVHQTNGTATVSDSMSLSYIDYPIAPSPGVSSGTSGRTASGGSASPPTPGPSFKPISYGAATTTSPTSPNRLLSGLSPYSSLPFSGRLPSIVLLDQADSPALGAAATSSSYPLRPARPPYSPQLSDNGLVGPASGYSPPQRYSYERRRDGLDDDMREAFPAASGSGTGSSASSTAAPLGRALAGGPGAGTSGGASPGLGLLCAAGSSALLGSAPHGAYDFSATSGTVGRISAAAQAQGQHGGYGAGGAPPASLLMPSTWRPPYQASAPTGRSIAAGGSATLGVGAPWDIEVEEVEEEDEEGDDVHDGDYVPNGGLSAQGSSATQSQAGAQGAYSTRPPDGSRSGTPAAQEGHSTTATPFISSAPLISPRSASHTRSRSCSLAPAELQHVLDNPAHHDVIRWNADGTALLYQHTSPRLLDILGKYFRHTSVTSLARQLNIYAFRRLTVGDLLRELEQLPALSSGSCGSSSESAGAPSASDWSGFAHPSFWRDEPGRAPCELWVLKPQGPKTEKGRANLAKKMAGEGGGKKRRKTGGEGGRVGGLRKGGLGLE